MDLFIYVLDKMTNLEKKRKRKIDVIGFDIFIYILDKMTNLEKKKKRRRRRRRRRRRKVNVIGFTP